MNLVLFDLDCTLIEGDSDSSWGAFMAMQGLVKDADHYQKRSHDFHRDYQEGILDMQAYLEFTLRPLTLHPREKILATQQQFIETIIKPMIRPKGLAKLEEHRKQGHILIMITATNEFVTRPIADLFAIDTLIATPVEMVNGQWTGCSYGVPSFREGKVTRLKMWLDEQQQPIDQCRIWSYSDSYNDRPLLDFSNHPTAVSPDAKLMAYAKQKGWTIEDWSHEHRT